jgi:hypothetical protein
VSDEARSYYGRPIIKEPVWTWEIPVYFFTGGTAGASAGLAWLSGLRGDDELARRAWGVALGAAATNPVLLISDLGRPRRFANMLRMLKVTSPMSVGSWLLGAFGASTAVAALNDWTGALPRAAPAAKAMAAALGLPLSTYTAALVANTSVPVWQEARSMLPFVFAAGAAASAGAVTLALTPPGQGAPARRVAVAGAAAELAGKALMERRLGGLAEPYRRGGAGHLARLAKALMASGGLLLASPAGRHRRGSLAGAGVLAAGALAARWSVFRAGFQSAADPRYTVGPQRRRRERGATRTARPAPAPAGG